MLQEIKNGVFREPRQGMGDRAGAVFGCMLILGGCFFIIASLFLSDFSRYEGPSYNLTWVGLGLMFVLQVTAELLPKNRTTVAGWLRAGAFLLALLSVIRAFARLAAL